MSDRLKPCRDGWAIDGSIYEHMQACLRKGDIRDGRTVAHFPRYSDALEVLEALRAMDLVRAALRSVSDINEWEEERGK